MANLRKRADFRGTICFPSLRGIIIYNKKCYKSNASVSDINYNLNQILITESFYQGCKSIKEKDRSDPI